MIIEKSENTFVKTFETKDFEIGDSSIILEILRSKIYSNPIRTMIQEVISNARDANRENNKPNEPIVVTLPSQVNGLLFSVKDSGIGISPNRMFDIFIKYGKSTKRDDNTQTGGFGIGAKSPFAYSDSFFVKTITKEDQFSKDGLVYEGCNVERSYCALIDENKSGSIGLVSEDVTDEETGTTISLNVKAADIPHFVGSIYSICEFWSVKPILLNNTTSTNYPQSEVAIETEDFIINGNGRDTFLNLKKVLVDEIPYSLNTTVIPIPQEIRSTTLTLKFKAGEINVSANREGIDYNEKTRRIIENKLLMIRDYLVEKASREIENAKTLWEAESILNKYNKVGVIIRGMWRNNPLTGQAPFPYTLSCHFYNRRYLENFPRRGNRHYRIVPSEDSRLVINDTESYTPPIQRVKTIFDTKPDINGLWVLSVPKPRFLLDKVPTENILTLTKEYDKYNPLRLSTFAKSKMVRKASLGPPKKIKRIRSYSGNAPDITFDTKDKKIIYYLLKGKEILCEEEKVMPFTILNNISSHPIYGVLYRYKDKIPKEWVGIREFAKMIVKTKEDENPPLKDINGFHELNLLSEKLSTVLCKEEGIMDEDLVEYLAIWQRVKNLNRTIDISTYFTLKQFLYNKNSKLRDLFEKIIKKYPFINTLNYNASADLINHSVHYIKKCQNS